MAHAVLVDIILPFMKCQRKASREHILTPRCYINSHRIHNSNIKRDWSCYSQSAEAVQLHGTLACRLLVDHTSIYEQSVYSVRVVITAWCSIWLDMGSVSHISLVSGLYGLSPLISNSYLTSYGLCDSYLTRIGLDMYSMTHIWLNICIVWLTYD